MSDGRLDFETRRARLLDRHQARARGQTATLWPDGQTRIRPRRIAFRLPLRGFVLLMAFFMMFKGFLLASQGSATYAHRVGILADGTLPERAGAFIMGIDPVSQAFADLFSRLI